MIVETIAGIGKTDGVISYCCSTNPAYFVEFEDEYSGYFLKRECTLLDETNNGKD